MVTTAMPYSFVSWPRRIAALNRFSVRCRERVLTALTLDVGPTRRTGTEILTQVTTWNAGVRNQPLAGLLARF